ncbi:Transcriptional regulatory protein, partial [Reticulomyxa filosa]
MGNCCKTVPEDLVDFLRCTPFFKIDEALLEDLGRSFERQYFPANKELWTEGMEDIKFTIIASGEVRLVHKLENKRSIIIQKEKGQCIGYEALNNKFLKVNYSATAIVDTYCYQLEFDALSRFWRSHSLAQEIFRKCHVIPLDSYLRKMNIFKSLNDEQSVLLANMFKWKILKQGETLFEEGEYGNTLYLVAIGCVQVMAKVTKENEDAEMVAFELEKANSTTNENENENENKNENGGDEILTTQIAGVG